MIYRGNKKVIGIYRGEQGVTAVCQGEELKWQSGPVFDNVITGTGLDVLKTNYYIKINGQLHNVIPDENGNFEIQVNMTGVQKLDDAFQNFYPVDTIDLNRLDTSEVSSISGMFVGCNASEVNLEKCDTSKIIEIDTITNRNNVKINNIGSNPNLKDFNANQVWDTYNSFLGAIWNNILVTRGFNRKKAGYRNVNITFYRWDRYTDIGLTPDIMQDIIDMGYNITIVDID